MFYSSGGRLHRRQKEKFLSVSGLGFPAQADCAHPEHATYARKTLYAYMPCAGTSGFDYIDAAVEQWYGGDWTKALREFVRDPTNKWCPRWVKNNYNMLNKEVDSSSEASDSPPAPAWHRHAAQKATQAAQAPGAAPGAGWGASSRRRGDRPNHVGPMDSR